MLERLKTECGNGPRRKGGQRRAKVRRNALAAFTKSEWSLKKCLSFANTSTLASVLYKKASWEVAPFKTRQGGTRGYARVACFASLRNLVALSNQPTHHNTNTLCSRIQYALFVLREGFTQPNLWGKHVPSSLLPVLGKSMSPPQRHTLLSAFPSKARDTTLASPLVTRRNPPYTTLHTQQRLKTTHNQGQGKGEPL